MSFQSLLPCGGSPDFGGSPGFVMLGFARRDWSRLLGEYAEALAFALQEQCIAELLIRDHAANANAMARYLASGKAEQAGERHLPGGGFDFDERRLCEFR